MTISAGVMETVNARTQLVGQNRLELLLFQLEGNQVYGINVFKVREVLQCPRLHGVPQSGSAMRGIAHIRGETLSVLDLSKSIGGSEIQADEIDKSFLIVAEYNRNVLSFLVRRVDRIVNLNWDQIIPPPEQLGTENYLTGVFEHDNELVEILDVEQILAELYPPSNAAEAEKIEHQIIEFASHCEVLVADDSAIARKQISKALEPFKCKVTTVNSGKEAWDLIQDEVSRGIDVSKRFSLLISDIEMPEMDGYTLTSKIKEDDRMKGMYVLLHTSLSGGFNSTMVEKVGANGFLAKFEPNELANVFVGRIRSLMLESKK